MSDKEKITGGILHMGVTVERHRRIKQAAAQEGITMKSWVIRACDAWLSKYGKKMPKIGEVQIYKKGEAPKGWVECDGKNGTPNLNRHWPFNDMEDTSPIKYMQYVGE